MRQNLLIVSALICSGPLLAIASLSAADNSLPSICEIKGRLPTLEIPVIDGEFRLVYQVDTEFPQKWGINDHCLFRDPDGRIHFFGIVRPFPKTAEAAEIVQREMKAAERPFMETLRLIKGRYLYGGIRAYGYIGHAVAEDIFGTWRRCKPALDSRPERRQYGAPFVVSYKRRYWMILPSATGLAVSDDLDHWQEHPTETPWKALGKGHRDPCILRLDDGTFLQYYAANDPRGNQWQSVHLARSRDLLKWERLELHTPHGERPGLGRVRVAVCVPPQGPLLLVRLFRASTLLRDAGDRQRHAVQVLA
ncbi:MAG: hypothetical protein GXP27_00655 [Planctomycetes bacterium]|nr:hypothetical protein [Planctomycetota bacterium]